MPRTTSSDPTPVPASGARAVPGDGQNPIGNDAATSPSGRDTSAGTDEASHLATTVAEAGLAARPGSTARWWLAVVAGVIVSLPLAWLLSHAALLPFFLGVFFFALFGLVIGAVMHRVAAPARPYPSATLLVGTTIVVAFGLVASLTMESRDFPRKMAVEAGDKTRDIGNRTIDEYRTAVANDIRRYLHEQYPPGGTLGYVRWALTSGTLKKGQIAHVNRTLRRTQCQGWWAVRVILSAGLLAFGIGSQTLPLKLIRERLVRAMDKVKETTPT